jgi:hypothetical protein
MRRPTRSTAPAAPPLLVLPGEPVFLAWDTYRQTVEYARRIAAQAREQGATVYACSLDDQVEKGHTCPVCGREGMR